MPNARKVLYPTLTYDNTIMDALPRFNDAEYALVLELLNRAYLHGTIDAGKAASKAKGA